MKNCAVSPQNSATTQCEQNLTIFEEPVSDPNIRVRVEFFGQQLKASLRLANVLLLLVNAVNMKTHQACSVVELNKELQRKAK